MPFAAGSGRGGRGAMGGERAAVGAPPRAGRGPPPAACSPCPLCARAAAAPLTAAPPHPNARCLIYEHSQIGGEVLAILTDNGQPVSPGTPLLLIKP